MKPAIWMGMILAIAAMPASAVDKCKDANGKTYYSDRGCVGVGEKVKGAPGGADHSIGTRAGDEEMARKCAEHHLGGSSMEGGLVRVSAYQVKTVAVKDVGPRRLFRVAAGLVSPSGNYYSARNVECLLRGDNVSFQTTPYEVLKW